MKEVLRHFSTTKAVVILSLVISSATAGLYLLAADLERQDSLQLSSASSQSSDNSSQQNDTSVGAVQDNDLLLTKLFQRVQQSVVQVSSESSYDISPQPSLGSGFIYDSQGHIVTNYHVVQSSADQSVDVTFPDGTIYRASIIGVDQYSDLAVLLVEDKTAREKLMPLPIANSSELRVGQPVVAIGNPFGLSGSMTYGIVSGLNRLIPAQAGAGFADAAPSFSIPNIIQTDAAINPGNSGGPLINMQGEVVGINSAIFSTTGTFAGVGFAIPSNMISKIVPVLIEKGHFEHSWLGISGIDMTPEIADALGLEEPRGFLVVDVDEKGPAAKAGIQGGDNPTQIGGRQIELGGDVILAINGIEVRKIDDLAGYLEEATEVGETVTLAVWRGGMIVDVNVTLAARPSIQDLL